MAARQGGRIRRITGDKRRYLVAQWWRAGRTCFYCRHRFAAPGLVEVGHVISAERRPDLAEDVSNMMPAHGGGAKRCPECGLACNQIASDSPLAPKDPVTGADLPFGDKFMESQIEKRRLFLANPRNSKRKPAKVPPPAPRPVGREW